MTNEESNRASQAFSTHERFPSKRRFQIEEAILILLILLSLGGVGITGFSATEGYRYWMLMIFVFGLTAMVLGFVKARQRDHLVRDLWVVQSVHWFGAMFIVGAIFSLLHAGMLDENATGLVILLNLALATFLDGIRLGWRFSMVGIFLAITAVVVAHVEEFMWVLIPLAFVIVAFSIYWEKRRVKKRLANE